MQWYDIEITKVMAGATDGKSMCITITDPHLISLTGGIVQGMSSSSVVQNGKLVGAVTHVMLSDPAKGYGIFIESMLGTAEGHSPSAVLQHRCGQRCKVGLRCRRKLIFNKREHSSIYYTLCNLPPYMVN